MMHAHFDLAVIGLGPVGATLAHLAGLLGLHTLAVDREPEHYHLPRAVHFDDEVMRVFQWIGIADELEPLLRVNPGMRFVDPAGKLLLDWPRPLERGGHGWHTSYRFHQPDLERILREHLRRRPGVEMRTSVELVGLEPAATHVGLELRDEHGKVCRVTADRVVGCDGARSFVRRHIGGGVEDHGFDERWLVVDVLLTRDKPELGDHSIQYCDPKRPITYVRGPENRRRFEIALHGHESDAEMTADERVFELMSRWIAPGEARIERAAVYTFHALLAQRWRADRLLIAGDAAHQTPPFMGQGMCAGIRDVANLAWKLALVAQGRSGAGLLDSYQGERHPHARQYIETAVRLGRLINAADSASALKAALPDPGGGATMRSISPSLGPGPGKGRLRGTLFGQPRLEDGCLMDKVVGYAPVIVADCDLLERFSLPSGVAVIRARPGSDAAARLEALATRAVLLRPDRYIHTHVDHPGELNNLHLWPP